MYNPPATVEYICATVEYIYATVECIYATVEYIYATVEYICATVESHRANGRVHDELDISTSHVDFDRNVQLQKSIRLV